MVTWIQKMRLKFKKKSYPHLKIFYGGSFAGKYKYECLDAYKITPETYYIPSLNTSIPCPPRDVIEDFAGTDGMVFMLSPERNIREFLKINLKIEDGKPTWIKMPNIASDEHLEHAKRESEFKLLYIQERKELETEKEMLMSIWQKLLIPLVLFISVIALIIIIYMATKSILDVMAQTSLITEQFQQALTDMTCTVVEEVPKEFF